MWSSYGQQNKKMKTMKTTIITSAKQTILISALILGLQFSHAMAKSAFGEPTKTNPVLSTMVPLTPIVSSPVYMVPDNTINLSVLAPGTPKEAAYNEADDLNDLTPELLKKFAPVPPAEADINDSILQSEINVKALKFTVPQEANFRDF